jgi:hypothetical protein
MNSTMSERSEILSGEIYESAMMAVQSGGNNLRLLAKYMIFMVQGTADVPGPLWPVRVLHGKRRTFTSFYHYLLDQPGDGIGLLRGGTKPLGDHGGDHISEDVFQQGDNVTLVERGNTAAYLAARIKRDFPEIAEQLAAGQFRSVRAAAKAAGIVRELTVVEQFERLWKKATAEDRAVIRAKIDDEPLVQ